jgi:16S rRNA (uracil1498-N3)-methyltransferase
VVKKEYFMAHTPRIYIDEPLAGGIEMPLPDKAHHHVVHVMRAKVGDMLILFNSTQGAYTAQLVKADKKQAVALVQTHTQPPEAPNPITLCPCLIKPARFDWVLEKATELGVHSIQPLLSDYTDINKLNLERAASIVQSAVEQSGRTYMPQVCVPQKLGAWLGGINNGTVLWAFEGEHTKTILQALQTTLPTPFYLMIGPEGGFSATEVALLTAHKNVQAVTLGKHILRAETASLSLLSVVAAHMVQPH